MVERPGRAVRVARAQPAAARADQGPQRGVADAPRGAGAAPMKGSIWLETAPPRRRSRDSTATCSADVAVIGGGIVGVTTALLLHEAGVRVVLIEADRIGHGVTGHTTAKVSSQHGLIYARLRSKHGARGRAALRRGQRGGAGVDRRRASRATGSTATSGGARPTRDSDSTRSRRRGRGAGGGRRRPAGVARRVDAAAVRGRAAPCASTTRPSSTRRSTCSRSPRSCPRSTSTRTPSRPATSSARPAADRRRAHRRRDPLPVPGPLARVRPRAPAALLRDRLPDRRRRRPTACSSAATRRPARSAPSRWTARSC